MDWKVISLLLLILVIAVFKGMLWLEASTVLVLFLWLIAEKRESKAPSGGKSKEEVLTPVIVTDAGEAPLLYPKNFTMKVYTKGKGKGGWYDAVTGAAGLLNIGYSLIAGKGIPGYKFDERWVEGKKKKDDKK